MKHQVISSHPSSYIIDEKALLEMMNKFGDEFNIIPIYIRRENLSSIDKERLDRDKDRIILKDSFYAAVIENNGTLDEFLKKAEKIIGKLI